MKGIILAGGAGTRLGHLTLATSKQLLPVYDKPMIFYPLTVLLRMGIRDIAVISTGQQRENFENLIIKSKLPGRYVFFTQDEPKGIAQAYLICMKWLHGSASCLVLGDNIMHGYGISTFCNLVKNFRIDTYTDQWVGCDILGCHVENPTDYGVVEVEEDRTLHNGIEIRLATGIQEKPKAPRSNLAVPGVYVCDGTAPGRVGKPSVRGELEITDVIQSYINDNVARVSIMPYEDAWFDAGTPDRLLEASNYVSATQRRTGTPIGSPFNV